jgi:hypothetical protein
MSMGACLVLVALAAFALLPWAVSRRSHCLLRAKFHAIQAQILDKRIAQYEWTIEEARRAGLSSPVGAIQAISEYRPLAEFHRDEKVRYERGMSRPWVSVAPDPGSTASEEQITDAVRGYEKESGAFQ